MPFAFIPKPLAVEDQPELSLLPQNVLYVSLANIGGVDTSGTALYEPYFASYRRDRHAQYLRYYNRYSETDYLDITYQSDKATYVGVKYVQATEVLAAYGKDWKVFFLHLTTNGLAKGEGCLYQPIATKQ